MIPHDKLISLYSAYYKEIFNYIYHLTRSYEASEDILQETFIHLIDYSKTIPINYDTVKSFLYKTAHNLSINYLKKNKLTDTIDNDIQQPVSYDTIEDDIFTRELQNEITEALKELDPISRSIFIIKRDSNYTNEEIARLLHISERTVRRKLQATLSYILSWLKNKGFFENL